MPPKDDATWDTSWTDDNPDTPDRGRVKSSMDRKEFDKGRLHSLLKQAQEDPNVGSASDLADWLVDRGVRFEATTEDDLGIQE